METGRTGGLRCAYCVTLFAETFDFSCFVVWVFVRDRRYIECLCPVIVIREEGPHNRYTALVCKAAMDTRTSEDQRRSRRSRQAGAVEITPFIQLIVGSVKMVRRNKHKAEKIQLATITFRPMHVSTSGQWGALRCDHSAFR